MAVPGAGNASVDDRAQLLRLLRAEHRDAACVVCMEPRPDLLFACCGVALHAPCAERWLGSNSRRARTCPQCRRRIPRGDGDRPGGPAPTLLQRIVSAVRGFAVRFATDEALGNALIFAASWYMLQSLIGSVANAVQHGAAHLQHAQHQNRGWLDTMHEYDAKFNAHASAVVKTAAATLWSGVLVLNRQFWATYAGMRPTHASPFATWLHMRFPGAV